MRFSAAAEVHSSVVNDDDDTSVASTQESDVSLDPRTAPGIVDGPMAGISVRAFGSGWKPGQFTCGGDIGSGTVRAFGSGYSPGRFWTWTWTVDLGRGCRFRNR